MENAGVHIERPGAEAPVGVFDSGIGGLTVVREIMRQIPDERIVYFGDTARVPYGSKSQDTIIKYTRQIIKFLQTQDVKAIVVACNTASAVALETIRNEIDIPIMGVVRPGARAAVAATRNNRVGIIGTEATVNSEIYAEVIHKINPDIQVFGKACPLFVPLAEEGMYKDPVTEEMARRYLSYLENLDIDTLILGCTHYPLLRSTVRKVVNDNVELVNPAYETAQELKALLEKEKIVNTGVSLRGEHPHMFYVSDGAAKFRQFANSILSYDADTTKWINIEEY